MGAETATEPSPGADLLALYDTALPQVYGYLLTRCGRAALAEDLTAATFLAAVHATRQDHPVSLSTGWLITVARNKLVDHWRKQSREERQLTALASEESIEDPWDTYIDAMRARDVLANLGAHHRAALTLRYVDDLPVAEVAAVLERTLHATEALLVRARKAFRAAYTERNRGADA
ncbi:MAG: RNA polymerase sigma factor [Acidimicrobiales bacterium]